MSNVLRPGDIGGLKLAPAKDQEPNLNMLVYGDVGVGKTRLGGSADAVPELRPVLIIDAEGGTFTLRSCYPNCDVIRVTDWHSLQAVYDELHAGVHDYRTVVIDSLTELQMYNMEQVMERLKEKDEERYDRQGDGEVASMLEWQINSKQVRKFIRAFRDLKLTTVFTALVKEDKTKSGKLIKRPSLPGKLAISVAGMFDIVGYLAMAEAEDEQQVRAMLTQPTDTITAKDRSGKLPKPYMINPTMADIYEYAVKGTHNE